MARGSELGARGGRRGDMRMVARGAGHGRACRARIRGGACAVGGLWHATIIAVASVFAFGGAGSEQRGRAAESPGVLAAALHLCLGLGIDQA